MKISQGTASNANTSRRVSVASSFARPSSVYGTSKRAEISARDQYQPLKVRKASDR